MAEKTTCAIIGGGPAGMVLGLLLARAGVDVTLLEKHGDFLRDFRGDTVHCSTMRLLDELGLWDRFSKLPYSEVRKAAFESNGRSVTYVDFERLRQPHPFIAMVPQWDLLNLLAEAAVTEPTFKLRMNAEVTGLLRDGDRVTGVRYQGSDGPANCGPSSPWPATAGGRSHGTRPACRRATTRSSLTSGGFSCRATTIRNSPSCPVPLRARLWV
jgi:2-polyprenyl-6-methoxyphenol hydroxylase-like FAD-dependent oxidoreductase